jgi:DNA/RNA-binding domain of Phe-tRNA-synthetase-like protein
MMARRARRKGSAAVEGLPDEWEVAPEPGWIAPILEDEFQGLSIAQTTVERGSGRSPEALRAKLRELSNRFYGANAIQMRQQPIPWAYRVFFRQIGLDPDSTRTPIEQLALDRMHKGAFKSQNRLDDALMIATVEIGVALRAFDADKITGRLGIRPSAPGERLEGRTSPLPKGTLLVADEERPIEILFGETAKGRGVTPKTKRTLLAAIGVKGVPDIAIEEALWLAAGAMRA